MSDTSGSAGDLKTNDTARTSVWERRCATSFGDMSSSAKLLLGYVQGLLRHGRSADAGDASVGGLKLYTVL